MLLEGECLFCFKTCSTERKAQIFNGNIPGDGSILELKNHLQTFFILKKILDVENTFLEEALIKESKYSSDLDFGDDSNRSTSIDSWFNLCDQCLGCVEQAWHCYQKVIEFTVKFTTIKSKLTDILKRETDLRKDKNELNNTILTRARTAVKVETKSQQNHQGPYVSKRGRPIKLQNYSNLDDKDDDADPLSTSSMGDFLRSESTCSSYQVQSSEITREIRNAALSERRREGGNGDRKRKTISSERQRTLRGRYSKTKQKFKAASETITSDAGFDDHDYDYGNSNNEGGGDDFMDISDSQYEPSLEDPVLSKKAEPRIKRAYRKVKKKSTLKREKSDNLGNILNLSSDSLPTNVDVDNVDIRGGKRLRKRVEKKYVDELDSGDFSDSSDQPPADKKKLEDNVEVDPFKYCPFCVVKYRSSVLLEAHIKIHEKMERGELEHYKVCSICSFPSSSKDLLRSHLNRYHIPSTNPNQDPTPPKRVREKQEPPAPLPPFLWRCPALDCSFQSERRLRVRKHLSENHPSFSEEDIKEDSNKRDAFQELNLTCPGCSKVLPNGSKFRRHWQRKWCNAKYPCKECGETELFTKAAFELHRRKMHPRNRKKQREAEEEGPAVCHVCGLDYNTSKCLNRHLNRCHPEEMSNHRNKSLQSLDRPKSERITKCRYCDLTSPFRGVILRHMREVHLKSGKVDVNAKKCPRLNCGKLFTTNFAMKRHIQTAHDKKTQFNCPFYCGKVFLDRGCLRQHLQYCKIKKMMDTVPQPQEDNKNEDPLSLRKVQAEMPDANPSGSGNVLRNDLVASAFQLASQVSKETKVDHSTDNRETVQHQNQYYAGNFQCFYQE